MCLMLQWWRGMEVRVVDGHLAFEKTGNITANKVCLLMNQQRQYSPNHDHAIVACVVGMHMDLNVIQENANKAMAPNISSA